MGVPGATSEIDSLTKPKHDRFQFRLMPRFETYPAVVSFVTSPFGKVLNIAIFALGLLIHGKDWWAEAAVIFLALSFFPKYRRSLIFAGTMYWLFVGNWATLGFIKSILTDSGATELLDFTYVRWAICATTLLFCVAYYKTSNAISERWVGHRPLISLLSVYLGMLTIAWTFFRYFPQDPIFKAFIWGILVLFAKYIWFLAYALADRKAAATPRIGWHLAYFHPFWGSTNTPFPKGAAYLRKIEAKNDHELSICQIKATKLLYWAGGLTILKQVFLSFVPSLGDRRSVIDTILPHFDLFSIPNMESAFEQSMNGTPYPFYLNILALICTFLYTMLSVAIFGHIIIATCRMAGFNALRNTYNPLGARSIAEFWNRYYYYFKELLVDMFFYPAFLRYFKKQPRLRVFFATMSAAFLGNCIYHYLSESGRILHVGPFQVLLDIQFYIIYAFVLAFAIGVSQLLNKGKPRDGNGLKSRIGAPMVVSSFYCLLSILLHHQEVEITFLDRINFSLSLLGIG